MTPAPPTSPAPAPALSVSPSEWRVIIADRLDEAEQLVLAAGVPREFVLHALDENELPRLEVGDGAILVMLRVPVAQGADAKEPWVTQPFGLVMLPDQVVAISRAAHPVLDAIERFASAEARRQPRLLLHALSMTATQYLRELGQINARVDRLEDELGASLENRQVLELLKCQKAFVYFATALRATELLLERVQKSGLLRAAPEDAELLEDVRVEVRQALEMTQTSAHILSSMMDAFTSIISNNLNAVMKFLAAVTVVLMIPTLVASLYGMNVALPLAGRPAAFGLLLLLSALLSMAVAWLFVKRRWL